MAILHPRAAAACFCVLLSACAASGPGMPSAAAKADYHRLFSEALTKSFQGSKENNVCLPPMYWAGGPGGAMEINQRTLQDSAQPPTSQAAQIRALEEAGLVTGAPVQRTVSGKPETFMRYIRTEKGNSHFVENRFCYARAELDRIVKWRGPAIFGEYQIAWVNYTTKTSKIADWARAPSFLAAFPTARVMVQDEPQKPRQALIDLTSEGWEVNEWSKVLQ